MELDANTASSPGPEEDQDESGIMTEDKSNNNDRASTDEKSPTQANNGNGSSAKSNAKDPSRPRRKKARRACFACQRAHLTCGDERPCMRCIKRGLQDQCHDGVRKKAKYLHDAPAEAFMPGFAQNYAMSNAAQTMSPVHGIPSVGSGTGISVSQPGAYYPQPASVGFSQYGSASQPGQMGPPMMDSSGVVQDFSTSQANDTPSQYQSVSSQQVSPQQEVAGALEQTPSMIAAGGQSFDAPYFDPSDPSLFNFNISDLNFGNHYGALEFGMLGHISSGAVNTPEIEQMQSMGQHQGSISYESTGGFPSGYNNYNQAFPAWQNVPNTISRQNSTANVWTGQNNGLDAYAIGEQPSSMTGASPRSQSQDYPGYQATGMSPESQLAQNDQTQNQQQDLLRQSLTQAQQQSRRQPTFPGDPHSNSHRKGRRDTSEIYTSIKSPYSYTQGFHALTAFLQKRYPSSKVLRIAKALASVRPSFISCNQNLNNDDLIFMEKCFQRTLCEYENFISSYGTPTLICRRTGEIASASKEFCMFTGWKRDVLLGLEPNLNVNTGAKGSGTQTGTTSRGTATPRIANAEVDLGRPQPVFVAELMDEDSFVQFYEDFAELAFGASHTTVESTPCTLLKYRTKDDIGWGANDQVGDDGRRGKAGVDSNAERLGRGEAGMKALGEHDGRVNCQLCWTVKRDVFDIPMLIVMNFLPII